MTGMPEGEVSLVVCSDSFIATLNREYRQREGPTDVLSFAMREGALSSTHDPVLGDIVISVETAARQANEEGRKLEDEFLLLFVHGLLHLLGFTHEGEGDSREMQTLTENILMGVTGTT
jgi:probable rRNA maturation factor